MSVTIPTFVKWAGGKTRLLGQFRGLFPRKIERYLEPFVGGGATFFYIKKYYNPKEIILSDANKELINCYRVVRDNPDKLIELLKEYKTNHIRHGKEFYYKIRDRDPKEMSDIEKAVRFIYLNKTCFNGLYRVNSKGKFNVPIGSYKKPNIINERNLREASRLLSGVKLRAMSFEKIISLANPNDFVYFDPPYLPVSKTSFTNYTSNSFSEEDQKKLTGIFKKLDKKGCLLMLSNSNHPLIEELYSEYRIERVKAGRVICCDPTKRGKITELVVMNY